MLRSWFAAGAAALALAAVVEAGSRERLERGVEELRKRQGAQPAPVAHTYVRGHGVVARAAEPDEVFLEYLRAMNAWHAHGAGMDQLYCEYRKAEARWVETATRLYGPPRAGLPPPSKAR